MSSIKYYAVSFGVLMAMTGSAIVLADEIDHEPQTEEEVSYVFEEITEPVFVEENPIVQDNTETMEEEEVEMILPELVNQEKPVEEITEPIVVEEALETTPLFAPADGWGEDENGTYYVENGSRLSNLVTTIDGSYYGFNTSGYLYKAERFDWNTYWYQAKDDGVLCRNEWYKFYDVDCYYGDNARGLNGLQNVDGKDYYFQDGRKQTNKAFEWNGNPYNVDDVGNVTLMDYDGWHYAPLGKRDMNTYLVVDGSFINSGVYYYQNTYFYFYDTGQLARNAVNRVNDITPYYVRSQDSGQLYVNQWYYDESSGDKYYYGAGGRSAYGFNYVDNKQYYFDYNGKLYADTASTLGSSIYIFKENGTYEIANADGWYDSGSRQYCVLSGKLLKDAVVNKGDITYYLTSDGHALKNDVLYSSTYDCYYGARFDGSLVKNNFFRDYYFGADGKSLPDGFVTVNNYDYYIENGRYITNTIRNMNGTNYIFDLAGSASVVEDGITENINTYKVIDGQLATGFYTVNDKDAYFEEGIMLKNGAIQVADHEYMVADREGKLLKNSFYTFDYLKSPIFKYELPNYPFYFYGTIYLDENGKACQGMKVIDGKTYYFGEDEVTGYQLYKNTVFKYNGEWYNADSNGVVHKEYTWSGWVIAGDDWYFMKEDELIQNQLYEVAGSTYAFDEQGKLVRNGFWTTRNPKYTVFRTDGDGKIIKGQWVTVENEGKLDGEYYFYENGTSPNDFANIGGTTYYFVNGRKLANEIHAMSVGSLFRFREDGSFTTVVADGVYEGRSLQVVRNGVLVTNEIYPYQGSYYLIDGSGSSKWNGGVQVINWLYDIYSPYYVYTDSEYNSLNRYPQIVYNGDYAYFPTDASNLVYGYLENYFGKSYAVVRENDGHGGFFPYLVKNTSLTIKGADYYADDIGVLHHDVYEARHTLSLDGNIGVNFYFSFSDGLLNDENAVVNFTLDGNTITQSIQDAPAVAIYRKFTVEATSIQMASKIKVDVMSSGKTVYSEKYSVKDYCEYKLADPLLTDDLKDLLESLLNYGGYAQIYFNKDTDNLANKNIENTDVSDVTAATLKPYEAIKTGSVDGLTMNGSTLSLDSMTTIKHYFTVGSGHTISEYTFTVNGDTVTPIKSGSMYYIEIPNIASNDLDTLYTLKVGNFIVKYYALSYAYGQLNKTNGNVNLQNALRALYKYNQAANVFLGD